MSLKDRINEDMKSAMRARETARLSAIRMLLAAMKQREVDERITLDDAAIVAIVDKLIKQRKDSIVQYEAGKRMDLADAERLEVGVLSAYLPAQADAAEVAAVIDAAVAETGAKSPADMGKVMGIVKAKLAGRADMGEVSKAIKSRLSA
jgi:uncharacterized protein YqeY